MAVPIIGNAVDPSRLKDRGRPGNIHPNAERVRGVTTGGPDDPKDRRLYLHADTLRSMLARAEDSRDGYCMIDHVGIQVDLWKIPQPGQPPYYIEQWQIIGVDVQPVLPPIPLIGAGEV